MEESIRREPGETVGETGEESRSLGRDLYEWVQALVTSVLAVVLLFTFVVRLIGVEGHSMVPTLQQTILRLRHIEGMEMREIAELTGSSEVAIRQTLSRARKALKQQYKIRYE